MREIEFIELLIDVNRAVIKRLAPLIQSAEVSIPEVMVLWKVHRSGPCRVTEIASKLGFPPSTLTSILDRLVAKGWLIRESDPLDRRAVVMRSTEMLADSIGRLSRAGSKSLEKVLSGLPRSVLDRLTGDLRRVLECLGDGEENAE